MHSFVVVEIYSLGLPFSFQGVAVTRSFPPAPKIGAVPEDEDTENLAGDESDSGDNANEFGVEQRVDNIETRSDTESSPEADHGLSADDAPVIDAAPSMATPAAQKRSTGGFVDED